MKINKINNWTEEEFKLYAELKKEHDIKNTTTEEEKKQIKKVLERARTEKNNYVLCAKCQNSFNEKDIKVYDYMTYCKECFNYILWFKNENNKNKKN